MQLINIIKEIINTNLIFIAILSCLTSLTISIFIVLTKKYHDKYTNDSNFGIQKFHIKPTPRIGGLAIFIALIVAWVFAEKEIKQILYIIILAGMPAFIVGFAEDITKKMGISVRLLATMLTAYTAIWVSNYSITRVDVWGLDELLKYRLVSIAFTILAISGIANAINIIDGFNGLVGMMATAAFIGLSIISWSVGDRSLSVTLIIMAFIIFGFFLINWPFGKIFMGDGGSYLIGFTLGWMAVLLIERNNTISAFTALLICMHPISEVLISIYRRMKKNTSPSKADKLHFHSLLNQRYVRRWFKNTSPEMRNSITGIIVGSFTIVLIILAYILKESKNYTIFAVLSSLITYSLIYKRMVRFKW